MIFCISMDDFACVAVFASMQNYRCIRDDHKDWNEIPCKIRH